MLLPVIRIVALLHPFDPFIRVVVTTPPMPVTVLFRVIRIVACVAVPTV